MLYWAISTCKVTLSLTVRGSASGTNGAVMQQITDWLQKLGLDVALLHPTASAKRDPPRSSMAAAGWLMPRQKAN